MNDTLQILDKVNALYSGAFSQLITITVAILALAGVILPIMFQLFQWRSFRNEQRSIQTQITNEIATTKAELRAEIQGQFQSSNEEFQKMLRGGIEAAQQQLDKEIAIAHGGIYYVQAANYFMQRDFPHAAESYAHATAEAFKGNDDQNGQRALGQLTGRCLPVLNSASFEAVPNLDGSLGILIQTLTERNTNGRFTDAIGEITRGVAAAKRRNPSTQTATPA